MSRWLCTCFWAFSPLRQQTVLMHTVSQEGAKTILILGHPIQTQCVVWQKKKKKPWRLAFTHLGDAVLQSHLECNISFNSLYSHKSLKVSGITSRVGGSGAWKYSCDLKVIMERDRCWGGRNNGLERGWVCEHCTSFSKITVEWCETDDFS